MNLKALTSALYLNYNMTDQLGLVTLKGIGKFSSGDCLVESRFILQRQFSHTVFLIHEEGAAKISLNMLDNSNPWELSGQLEDGRAVFANQLFATESSNSAGFAELTPFAGVVFGQAAPSILLEAHYPLIGMFDGKFSIKDSGWTIETIDSDKNCAIAKSRSKAWRIPLEGLTLRLSCKQKSLEEYHERAREVMTLLSLALGNGVTSYRQIVRSESLGLTEFWRKMTGDDIGPGPIIPTHLLGQFLNQALSVWAQWKSDKKAEVRLAITNINLSATGYIDTRLFQISQAWESIAKSWIPLGELNEPEEDLRSRIKACYREWKKENPESDPEGNWRSRITFPFRWPLAKRQMESLATSKGIDFSKFKLDLEALKKERDSVAHTGKMNPKMNEGTDAHKMLSAAQFGLQLILIYELGYSGSIVASKNGWRTIEPIKNYLKP